MSQSVVTNQWTLYIDGASRNNPGHSGVGIYILKNDILFLKCGYYVGIKTNNQAEYLALLFGLLILLDHSNKDDTMHIISDSQLLVRQLLGQYKVRDGQLLVLYQVAHCIMSSLHVSVSHVLRAYNKEADAMANYGLDNKISPPAQYIARLKSHNIVV